MEGSRRLDEAYEEEVSRLDEDLQRWRELYSKDRAKYEELAKCSIRIQELEKELEERKRVLGEEYARNRYQLVATTALILVATLVLVKVLAYTRNVWLFFIVGAVLGFGWGALAKLWLQYR